MSEQTLGEKRVRTEFNPSKDGTVDKIKQKTAELINLVGDISISDENSVKKVSEFKRLVALAQTAYEEAAMWAVKAATA